VAVIESLDEPWFEDARVKTAVTILQRTSDADKRDGNIVRFVRLFRPLAEILGARQDEAQRQAAAEKLRDLILKTKSDYSSRYLRILTKEQRELWNEGLSVAQMFEKQKALAQQEIHQNADEDAEDDTETSETTAPIASDYGGGKWGRYLRAPRFYFDVMREFGSRFVRFGEIATIKRGITSGCDAFFMPRNVTTELLSENETEMEWQSLALMTRCPRKDAATGKVVVVRCGDGTLHPIEHRFVRPEMHSLMQVDRPIVEAGQSDRLVLWVNEPLKNLKGTLVHQYITWGSQQTFASKKSKPVSLPLRSTCAARPLWYDVTGREAGIGFWPKAQKYRHIIPWNPGRLACNNNLYDIHPQGLSDDEERALMAILNSTLVGFFKHFYGRYAGSEGTLKTEIVDALMLEVPSPVGLPKALCRRLGAALERISKRVVTHLVEQPFLDCHTEADMRVLQAAPLGLPLELQRQDRRELDALTFEALGVVSERRREQLIDQLYSASTLYHREQRIQDIQSTINRNKASGATSPTTTELAEDAWGELEDDLKTPLSSWLAGNPATAKAVQIPDGPVRLPDSGHFFEANTVFFGSKPAVSVDCSSRGQAELVHAIATSGLRGVVPVPVEPDACRELAMELSVRLSTIKERLGALAESRAGSDKIRAQVFELMYRWAINGRQSALQSSVQ
jgi:hypothetical protein